MAGWPLGERGRPGQQQGGTPAPTAGDSTASLSTLGLEPGHAPPTWTLDTRRLRRALVLGNLALLVVVGLLSTLALWQSRDHFRQRALDTAQGQLQALAQALRARADRFDAALQAVVGIGADPEALRLRVPRRREVMPPIEQLHVTLSDGQLLAQPAQAPPLSTPEARRQLLARVLAAPAGEKVLCEPVLAADGQTWLMLMARRLQDDLGGAPSDAAPRGVMVHVELRTSAAQDLFAQAELGAHGAVSLRTQALYLVARHVGEGPAQRPSGVGTNRVSEELLQVLREQPDRGHYFAATVLDGIERANAYQRLDPYPLLLLVGLGTSDVLQPWYRHVAQVVALLTGSTVLLAGLSWALYGAMQRAESAGAGLVAARSFLARTERIAAVGGWELDLATRRLRCTPQAAHILGCAPGQSVPLRRALARFAPGERRALRRQVLKRLRQRPGLPAGALEWPLKLSSEAGAAAERQLRVVVEPPALDAGHAKLTRLVGTVQDVSEQHARELALAREQALRQRSEQQVRELDELLRERSELQDVLAHEVRQPLNNASAALQGAAAALAGTASAAAALPLTRAQAVMGQVIASIDNTLAVAKLLAHSGPVSLADTDLDTLVAVAIGDLPAAARQRVQVQRDTAVRTASLDLGLMRLALRNLLANALAYGSPGSPVTLRLGDSEEPLGLTLDVENQAVADQGVPPALVPHLFKRGSRGRPDRPGNGLGLYIVHRVMSLHGGRAQLLRNAGGRVVMRLLLLADVGDDPDVAAFGP